MGRRAAVVGAVGGARARAAVHDVRGRRRAARPAWRPSRPAAWRAPRARADGRYDLGCLYIGRQRRARAATGTPEAFARRPRGGARNPAQARCDRVLVVAIPLDLGRPRARRARSRTRTRRIAAAASEPGARARPARLRRPQPRHDRPRAPDRVRPGGIAERALDVLAADGMDVRVRPATLIRPRERTPLRALQRRLRPTRTARSRRPRRRARQLLEPSRHVAVGHRR